MLIIYDSWPKINLHICIKYDNIIITYNLAYGRCEMNTRSLETNRRSEEEFMSNSLREVSIYTGYFLLMYASLYVMAVVWHDYGNAATLTAAGIMLVAYATAFWPREQ